MISNQNNKKVCLIVLLASLFAAFVFIVSCEDTSNNPKDDEENYPPGSRKYEWTADTIKAYYTYFNSIWGLAPDDVWAVSLTSSVYENIYRYNGINWRKDTTRAIGNTVSLWGTENNVWICCKDGRIWNYSNGSFNSSEQFRYEDTEILFFSMAGKDDDAIYACGGKGVPNNRLGLIYKYNGAAWELHQVLNNYGNLFKIKYSSRNEKYYLLGYLDNDDTRDTTKLFEYDGYNINEVSSYEIKGAVFTISEVNGVLYLSKANSIYTQDGSEFSFYLDVNKSNFLGQIWGRNKRDLVIQMNDGVLHYNGTDSEYIFKFPSNIEFGNCALVLEKDIFIHAFDNNTGYNIIYHGKLVEE